MRADLLPSAPGSPHPEIRVWRRGLSRLTTAAALSVLTACSWFTDFKQQPKIDPWESTADTIPPRGNPQNSVSVYGTAAPGFIYGRGQLPGAIDSMSGIPNPVAADARSIESGRKVFQINCAPCHGAKADGNGTVVKYGFVPINLLTPVTQGRTDGYIFGMMRNGRGLMPSYNRIEEPDRWDVVNYLRALQGKIPGVQAIAAPEGLPGETGDKVPGATQMGPTRPAPYYKHIGSQAGASATGAASAPAAERDSAARAVQPNAPARPDSTTKGVRP
jgi:mono/diheme cytochrome c family protein